jgi:chorismate synthase
MAGNTFGTVFRVTTWGESHGPALGAVIDGCPPGLPLAEVDINSELVWRRSRDQRVSTARREPDQVEILSGVFEGHTTGTPISLMIGNRDVDSRPYEPLKNLFRDMRTTPTGRSTGYGTGAGAAGPRAERRWRG